MENPTVVNADVNIIPQGPKSLNSITMVTMVIILLIMTQVPKQQTITIERL
jgi:hypothetical protein